MNYFLSCLFLLFSLSGLSSTDEPRRDQDVLISGWYSWDPYQYVVSDRRVGDKLSGLDIELLSAISEKAEVALTTEPVSWKQHQRDLESGKRDIAAGATYTEERAEYVHFSEPYRFEENSLFVRRGEEGRFQFETIPEFLKTVKEEKLKLSVLEGFVYADPQINEWIRDPSNQDLIVYTQNDQESLKNLLETRVDGFLADRIVGATEIWKADAGSRVNEVSLNIRVPIHLMFSKKTVPLSLVHEFNKAIKAVKSTPEYDQILTWYLHPVFLLKTIDATWFRIVEILGTVAFAISGLVIAYREKATLFGAFIFAMLPSLGGGIMRDIIFDRPVGAMETPFYMYIVFATVFIGYVFIKIMGWVGSSRNASASPTPSLLSPEQKHTLPLAVLAICDGMGLAAFTVAGVVITVLSQVTPLWLWGAMFAFITGAGGGILRDLLSKKQDIVSLKGDIYPEVAVIWGLFLSLYLSYESHNISGQNIEIAVIITVLGAFVTRLCVYFFDVRNILFSK